MRCNTRTCLVVAPGSQRRRRAAAAIKGERVNGALVQQAAAMAVQEAELRARGSVKQEHHVAPHLAHCERVAAGADRQGGHLVNHRGRGSGRRVNTRKGASSPAQQEGAVAANCQ